MAPHDAAAFTGPRLLKVRQAQAMLNLGNTKFYELVSQGQIELIKIGRSSFVKAEALEEFIDGLTSTRKPSTNRQAG